MYAEHHWQCTCELRRDGCIYTFFLFQKSTSFKYYLILLSKRLPISMMHVNWLRFFFCAFFIVLPKKNMKKSQRIWYFKTNWWSEKNFGMNLKPLKMIFEIYFLPVLWWNRKNVVLFAAAATDNNNKNNDNNDAFWRDTFQIEYMCAARFKSNNKFHHSSFFYRIDGGRLKRPIKENTKRRVIFVNKTFFFRRY